MSGYFNNGIFPGFQNPNQFQNFLFPQNGAAAPMPPAAPQTVATTPTLPFVPQYGAPMSTAQTQAVDALALQALMYRNAALYSQMMFPNPFMPLGFPTLSQINSFPFQQQQLPFSAPLAFQQNLNPFTTLSQNLSAPSQSLTVTEEKPIESAEPAEPIKDANDLPLPIETDEKSPESAELTRDIADEPMLAFIVNDYDGKGQQVEAPNNTSQIELPQSPDIVMEDYEKEPQLEFPKNLEIEMTKVNEKAEENIQQASPEEKMDIETTTETKKYESVALSSRRTPRTQVSDNPKQVVLKTSEKPKIVKKTKMPKPVDLKKSVMPMDPKKTIKGTLTKKVNDQYICLICEKVEGVSEKFKNWDRARHHVRKIHKQ